MKQEKNTCLHGIDIWWVCEPLFPPQKPCFPGAAYIYILILIIINILIIIYIIIISLICWGKSGNCRFCRFPPHGIP